jgi:hypothetical protein
MQAYKTALSATTDPAQKLMHGRVCGCCISSSVQVKALLQELNQHNSNNSGDTTQLTRTAEHQQQQQQQVHPAAAQSLPWQQLCTMRRSLNLALLPRQLTCGSQYLPSADGINQNLLLLLHGLGDKPAAFTGG